MQRNKLRRYTVRESLFSAGNLAVAHRRGWHEPDGPDACLAGWFVLKPRSTQSEDQAAADLCAVGYAVQDIRFDPNSKDVLRCLVRLERDSKEVFQAIGTGEEEALWWLGDMDEPIATGVLDFELSPLTQDEDQHWLAWSPERRTMPDAVELRLVLASPGLQKRLKTQDDWDWARLHLDQINGRDVRELRTLIYLGPDAD